MGDAATDLRVLLRSSSAWADERWRQWARDWMEPGALTAPLLGRLWHEVCAFDKVLAAHVEEPLAVPDGTVIVAGSGKESFKTFNVSTAASILAAAAGIKVVKGVSRSVSAVSGAADVLDALGVVATGRPEHVAELTEQVGIAFVSYAAFCPSYAGRYDGVFRDLSPFSFFMPSSVLAVRASAFVYGLAHPDVELAARAIVQALPELDSGFVVSTTLASGEVMDERAPWGTSVTADMRAGAICCWERTGPSCDVGVASSRRSPLHPSRQRRLTPLVSGVGRGRRMYGAGGTQRCADRPGGSSRDV